MTFPLVLLGTPLPVHILYTVCDALCSHSCTYNQTFDSALGGTSKMSSHFPLHRTPVVFSFSLASLQGLKHYLHNDTDGDTGK